MSAHNQVETTGSIPIARTLDEIKEGITLTGIMSDEELMAIDTQVIAHQDAVRREIEAGKVEYPDNERAIDIFGGVHRGALIRRTQSFKRDRYLVNQYRLRNGMDS